MVQQEELGATMYLETQYRALSGQFSNSLRRLRQRPIRARQIKHQLTTSHFRRKEKFLMLEIIAIKQSIMLSSNLTTTRRHQIELRNLVKQVQPAIGGSGRLVTTTRLASALWIATATPTLAMRAILVGWLRLAVSNLGSEK